METASILRIYSTVTSVGIAGTSVPVVDRVKSPGVTLVTALTFQKHVGDICKHRHIKFELHTVVAVYGL